MLFGRGVERDAVRAALDERRPVALVGSAGIGKSTLARAVLADIGPHRETGALGSLRWVPLLPFRRLLGFDPPDEPELVAGAVVNRTSDPILLDDLQWADGPSLEVLAHLVDQVPIVATVRSGEHGADDAVAVLELLGTSIIELGALEEADASDLVDHLHPGLAPDARRALLDAADGNPLLLTELPKGNAAQPVLVSALASRVDDLTAAGRTAVVRLAVLGRPATPEELGPGSAELLTTGLAQSAADRCAFAHALLGEVLAEQFGEVADQVRRELVPVVPATEGAHLLAAAGDLDAARALALRTAETADRRTRAAMLDLAIRCAPDVDPDTRFAAARLHTSLSEPDRARRICAVPERKGLPPAQRGALLAAEAEAAWLQGQLSEALELLERALVDLRGTRTAAEVAALAGSTVAATYVDLDGRPALERAREAVRLADEIGAEQGYARSRLASVLLTAGEPGWAELYQQVIELATEQGDEDLRRTAWVGRVLGHWVTGEPAVGEALALQGVDAGPRQELDVTWLTHVAYAAILGLVSGRSRRALVDRFDPFLAAWPMFRARPFLEAAVTLSLADLGEHARASELLAASTAAKRSDRQWRSIGLWAQADAAWLAGRSDAVVEARAEVEALALGAYPASVHVSLLGAHVDRSEGRAPTGSAPTIGLAAWRGAPIEWDALARLAAGDALGAVTGLVRAAGAWRDSDVRSEVRCRWAAGDVAAATGLPDAVPLLEAARDRATELGLVAMLDRIHRSLRGVGVVSRAPSSRGRGGLTSREEQVLDLAGTGMRTVDIALALGVEPSTVESLARSATRKLGARTRTAAAAKLRQLQREQPAPIRGGEPTSA